MTGAVGAGAMTLLAVPGAESVPARLVTVQLKPTVPVAPARKVRMFVPFPDTMLPLVKVQAYEEPDWAGTDWAVPT